ncbi:hypothetical protein KP509_01G080300 [Ceratopteris richardii]|uniref:GS catalytic domain-containing protein n=1 Tax=Ceratopteris richardii TaxID=49495 RepID=A0A8T2VMV2_CERRI|nr:hypothetical protein KP509_01G080300 [Ceratopteris richardii]
MAPLTERELSLLRDRIYSAPLVDGHTRSLVDHQTSSIPFLCGFEETEGHVRETPIHTLSFKRGLREIASHYGCNPSLKSIEAHRQAFTLERLYFKCLESSNMSAVLIDDSLPLDKTCSFDWHKSVFPNAFRILQIETLTENVFKEVVGNRDKCTFDDFVDRFMSTLKEYSKQVVALKSMAGYHGALDIDPQVAKSEAENAFKRCIQPCASICNAEKCLSDYIFLCGLKVATECGLPLQVHTGFTKRGSDLVLINPLHLCPVLEDQQFTKSRLVLLHASYPFLKEAAYLSNQYPQVYLDFGLAVTKFSFKGLFSAVNELLETAPLNKILFSTDAYAFPEAIFLGIKWAREVLLQVLQCTCASGDLYFDEALEAASDILGGNANNLYQLSHAPNDTLNQVSKETDPSSTNNHKTGVKYVRLLWSDSSGQRRCRVVPKERFEKVVKTHGVGLTTCCMGMSSHVDGPAKDCGLNAVGEIRILPDSESKWIIPWSLEEELTLVDMHMTPGSPWEYCPRSTLKRLSAVLQAEFGLVMKAGFESEFYILKPDPESLKWVGLDNSSYCSSLSFDAASDLLFEISAALSLMDVNVQQLHAEAGCGQYEISLNYEPCLKAADDVLILRETVKALVQRRRLLATFLPKLFPNDIGSGSHVHVSLWAGDKNVFQGDSSEASHYGISKIGQEFLAGVFHHLPSILAFTAPLPNSYDRIKPQTWSGAHYCWGRENREAPLRTSCPPGTDLGVVSNFELKSFDGCANPHLGLAAILAAGIDGMRRHMKLSEPIDNDPSLVEESLKLLPTSLDQSTRELEQNSVLKQLIGTSLVKCIIAVRQSEIEFYKKEGDVARMLAERY